MELDQIFLIVMHLCFTLKKIANRNFLLAFRVNLVNQFLRHINVPIGEHPLYLFLHGLFHFLHRSQIRASRLIRSQRLLPLRDDVVLLLVYLDLPTKVPDGLLAAILLHHEVVVLGTVDARS